MWRKYCQRLWKRQHVHAKPKGNPSTAISIHSLPKRNATHDPPANRKISQHLWYFDNTYSTIRNKVLLKGIGVTHGMQSPRPAFHRIPSNRLWVAGITLRAASRLHSLYIYRNCDANMARRKKIRWAFHLLYFGPKQRAIKMKQKQMISFKPQLTPKKFQ